MTGPENLRVYGVLLRAGRVLLSAETVGGREVIKFPGGGVEAGETPETALTREYDEETGLLIAVGPLLHVPGTLFSDWTFANYTPLYYRITAAGTPRAPDHEPITLDFWDPEAAMASGRMAAPEIVALGRALATGD